VSTRRLRGSALAAWHHAALRGDSGPVRQGRRHAPVHAAHDGRGRRGRPPQTRRQGAWPRR